MYELDLRIGQYILNIPFDTSHLVQKNDKKIFNLQFVLIVLCNNYHFMIIVNYLSKSKNDDRLFIID